MKKFSFRVKIIWTIILTISLFSLISFSIFNLFLRDKLETQIEETYNHMNLLRDQYYFTISQHDGRIIKYMLKDIEREKDVLKTYLVNSKLKITYPSDYSSLNADTASLGDLFKQDEDISIKSYNKAQIPFHRVFIRLQNSQSCVACHTPNVKNLGIIVMDLSSHGTQGIMNFTKQFSLFFTVMILITIFILVGYLHYKFIKKSLNQFRLTISEINKGKLEMRIDIPQVRELGRLGNDFNEMLDNFELAQTELQIYHKKEMQNAQKLATIGEMSARIAHEIRNPITGISRAMEIIVNESENSKDRPIFEEIQRQANRVNQAITNLLKFSQSKDLTKVKSNINELIRSQVFFLENQALDKEINFKLVLNSDIPEFSYDQEQLENVLLNLSFNAIQAIPDNGLIIFSSSFDSTQKNILISICDNGSGIPEAIGKDIFKPFYTTRTKGTGLGLAISKDIIEKHDGKLWYENNRDTGCTFFISLPL